MKRPKNPTKGGSYIRRKDGTLHRLTAEEEARRAARGRKSFSEAVDQTLAEDRFTASAVFDRMKEGLGCDSDAELAWILGTSPQNVWHKRKRNSVPYREAVYLSLWGRLSLDYLLTGRGDLHED
jgi:hypothetical protein